MPPGVNARWWAGGRGAVSAGMFHILFFLIVRAFSVSFPLFRFPFCLGAGPSLEPVTPPFADNGNGRSGAQIAQRDPERLFCRQGAAQEELRRQVCGGHQERRVHRALHAAAAQDLQGDDEQQTAEARQGKRAIPSSNERLTVLQGKRKKETKTRLTACCKEIRTETEWEV